MTKFYVDEHGAYIGGFDGAEPPDGAIEVPLPPASAFDKWDGASWIAGAAASEAQIVAGYMAAVQQHMDARAVTFGYDNLISVITYAEEPAVPRYQAEGQAFRAWRSACWYACEQMLAAVKAGDRTAPTHAELLDELPELGLTYTGPFAG